MIRRPPRSTLSSSSAASDVYKRQAEYQARYGDAGLSSNIAVPTMRTHSYSVRKFDDPDEVPEGYPEKLKVGCRVIVADPQDAERVARRHLRKEPNFGMFMDSVISTTDNEHWRQQREHLVEAFLPLSSLAAIMPVSLSRAKRCAERLTELTRETDVVDMSDFLLHEAQAQLQLALLGAPESLMDATNSDLRKTFMLHPDAVSGRLSHAMSELYNLAQTDETLGLPSDDCPVKGPLARALQSGGQKASTDYGNMLIILFAGHDTTGHTMTWLMYELARRPELQRRVHAELDEFYGNLAGRDPIYQDLSKLVFLDRCITETLRLWPAVANGTFRQLQFEEQLTGLDGAQITLPRETLVQVANWSRHRNPQLWGDDAEHFNPDRNFRPEEVSHVGCPHAAMNPQSDRFSPFAHNPRSCLGKNFAGMEMRLILPELLRRFEFSLAPPYDHLVDHVVKTGSVDPDGFRGVNAGGTMGPLNLEALPGDRRGARHMIAMKLRVTPRHRSN
eukprot:TRINITY_DN1068_c0_g1_i20.p1 TRINITY_DN1068_c0_g1~~TRINITY_DN1068_c0_g1_i20.p1  ORF type:complete len:504 (-),score=107.77 TRINITY_DN1068_c0_g1_i20:584-2095(-)